MDENRFIRGIVPMDFAMNRSLELYNLVQRVKRTCSSRLAIQKLPCHLRRRSASHKPYKLPLRRVGKCYGEECSITAPKDMSYLTHFQVCSDHNDIVQLFKNYTDWSIGSDIESEICIKGLCEGETILYANIDLETPYRQVIGPIKYSLAVGSNETKLWIWSHPSCAKQIDQLLNEYYSARPHCYDLISVQHKFNRYRLIGPQSLEILFSTLLACGSKESSSSINDEILVAGRLWNSHQNDGRLVYNLLVQLSLVKTPRKNYRKQSATFKNISSIKSSLSIIPNDMITFHSKFKSITLVSSQKYIPVSVVLNQPFDRLQGHVDIVVRDTVGGRRLWSALINRNVCVGGMRELQTYFYNHLQPLFPYDYPDCVGYYQSTFDFYASECMKLKKNQRMPPPKRVNFPKLRQIEHESLLFCNREWTYQWKAVSLEYFENCFLSIPTELPTPMLDISAKNEGTHLRVCRNGLLLNGLSSYFNGKVDSALAQSKLLEQLNYYDSSSTLVFVTFDHVNLRLCPKSLATIHLSCFHILAESSKITNCLDKDYLKFNCFTKNRFSIDMNWPFLIIGQCTAGGYSYRFGYPTAQGYISLKALHMMIQLQLKSTSMDNSGQKNYRNAVLLRNRGSDRYFRSHFSIPMPSYQL